MVVGTKKALIELCKKQGDTVLEVITKQLYIIPKGHSADSIEELKTEWFKEFENKRHAFKENCFVGGSNEVIEIKEL